MDDDSRVMLGRLLRKKGVSMERLVSLCEIHEAGGIMAAAEGDPSRQSQLSRQVKELEDALDLSLMDRSTSPSRVSPEGEAIVRLVRRFLSDFDRVAEGLSQSQGPIRIAASESLVLWYLMPILAGLGLTGERSVQFLNLRSRDSSKALLDGRVDLAISHSVKPSPGIEVRDLAGYGLRLVGLSSKRPKKWADLKAQGLATLGGDGKMRQEIDRLIENYPDGPFVALECTSHFQLLVACETMGLLAVIPEIALVQTQAKKLPSCRIEELEELRYSVSCGWNQDRLEKDPHLSRLVSEVLK